MTRDDWRDQFVDELAKLRPYLADSRLARTLARHKYDPKQHPRDLARQYDKVQKRQAMLSALKKKPR